MQYLRHPSYTGWFWWALGTQLVLQNPLSFVLFFVGAFLFFRDRIEFEEYLLLEQFGKEYDDYMKRSYIGIPFIKSSKPKTD